MIDSTKLELDEHYYLKLKNGKVEVQKFIGGFVLRNDDEIAEVLGKVPSYEEYQQLLSDQLAKNEGVEINAEFEAENKRLKYDVGNLGYKIKNQRHEIDNRLKEIEKLKSLLKEIRGKLHYINTPVNQHNIFSNDFIKKLDQVLGEKL